MREAEQYVEACKLKHSAASERLQSLQEQVEAADAIVKARAEELAEAEKIRRHYLDLIREEDGASAATPQETHSD
eukprot:10654290-Alexandrium_andersonii.AAC.1